MRLFCELGGKLDEEKVVQKISLAIVTFFLISSTVHKWET